VRSHGKCKVSGCDRVAIYKSDAVCQMHYFRKMRNGTYEKIKKPDRWVHSAGYIVVCDHSHPLSSKRGLLYEHRKVVYSIYGDHLPPCEFCKSPSDWYSRKTHIDHIDKNKANNDPKNLRVLCNPCNSRRDRKPEHEFSHTTAITINGETKTPTEWAREPGAMFCGASIKRRFDRGLSGYDAVFGKHRLKKER